MQEDGAQSSRPLWSYEDIAFKWLTTALDIGISETDFWSMTFAEVERAAECWQRTQKRELQERAKLTHILADLIGHSVGRIYSQDAKMPTLQEAFPSLFEESEEEREKKANATMELSALRFRQFAQAYNDKKRRAKED